MKLLLPNYSLLSIVFFLLSFSVNGQGLDSILLDFGNVPSATPWVNLSDAEAGAIGDLPNTNGRLTGYQITVVDAFNNTNSGGNQDNPAGFAFPATATGDSFFGNVGTFGGREEPTGAIRLDSLEPDKEYTFTIFASRNGVSDNRQAEYVAAGATTESAVLDASNNADQTVSITVQPTAEGSITLSVAPGPDNSNGTGFYYLGAFILSYPEQDLPPPVVVTSDTFLIDFGTNLSPIPWNNVTDPRQGRVENLMTVAGFTTDVAIAVTDSFNNINLNGTTDPDPSTRFIGSATGDSFFGSNTSFGGLTEPTGAVTLTGLDPRLRYDFSLFASRAATDNREAMYTLEGLETVTVALDAASNTDNTASAALFPAADGSIVITAAAGPNNSNSAGFYYLGAMRVGFDLTPAVAPLDTVLIDFGGTSTTPEPWNNITDPAAGILGDLLDSRGFSTGFGIQITDRFNGINTAGSQNPDPALGIPATASGDSFFGSVTEFGGLVEPTAELLLTGLDPGQEYNLSLFGSRTASDNRETQYAVTGQTVDTVYLDVSSNSDNVATTNVMATEAGTISIKVEPGPNNNNSSRFYYLGALRLTYPDRAPAGGSELTLLSPNGGETYQARRPAPITWSSRNVTTVQLEYSVDGRTDWAPIDTVPAVTGRYEWTVPNLPSVIAAVRIIADTLQDESDEFFSITADTTTCTIVVLGSSTAAGTGASTPDSAWVNLYRSSLVGDTRYKVVNLGRGGANTYNILPTGSSTPPVDAFNVDRARNVTQALTFDPFAIIINMPSNDAANNVTAAEQMLNFRLIAEPALAAGVKVYVATTQPRNFTNPAQIAIQEAVRDSILAEYGEFAINFWDGIATAEGRIDPAFDSGDGVHVNNRGHLLLFQRVAEKMLDTLDCTDRTVGLFDGPVASNMELSAYPNPTSGDFTVEMVPEMSGTLQLQVFDLTGRSVYQRFDRVTREEAYRTVITGDQIKASSGQVYICVATLIGGDSVRRGVLRVLVR